MNKKILQILEQLLGQCFTPQKEWLYFLCPFCKKNGKQKQKFHIHSESYAWKCWVCEQKGGNLFSLLSKLGRWEFKNRIEDLLQKPTNLSLQFKKDQRSKQQIVNLPQQFIPLSNNSKFILKRKALNYLKKRGIGRYQIEKYNIGVCQTGRYKNRIIIPSYNINGFLNYFTARSMDCDNSLKYINPKSRRSELIMFQNLINWNFPIILTQGIFDAITVNFNAIPLMGKIVSDKLLETLLFYDATVIVSLDDDARDTQNKLLERLNKHGLHQVYFINLKSKDANEMGRFDYWNFLSNNKEKYTVKSSLNLLKERVLNL